MVEFDYKELVEHLESCGINTSDFWLTLEDMRRVGRIL